MKTIQYYAILIILLLVGCTPTSESDASEPVITFPSLKVISADIGGEYSLTFDAAVSWSITSDVTWIDFKSSGGLYSLLEGDATQGCEVVFEVSDSNHGFADAIGSITLSIGEQQAVVATVLRSGEEFSFVSHSEDNSLKFVWSDEAQLFEAELSFETNFDWTITSFPSWVTVPEITQGKADEPFVATLSTVFEAYSFEEQMTSVLNITYQEDSSVSYPLEITTTGAKGMMIIPNNRGVQEFSYGADAATPQSYTIEAIVEGDSSSENVFALLADGSVAGWITIEKLHEDIQYGSCLKQISNAITVDTNYSSNPREATIYVVPTSVYKQYQDLSDIVTYCNKYIVAHLTQDGSESVVAPEEDKDEEDETLTLEFTQGCSVTGKASISKMNSSHAMYQYFIDKYSVSKDAIFILKYQGAGLREQINFPYQFNWDHDSIEVGLLSDYASSERDWLSVDASNSYFTVAMNSSIAAEGVILLQHNLENKVAIYCIQTM